jgi:hypothetical protein
MRYCTYLALLLLASCCAFAQTNASEHQWSVKLKVVDEDGNPVSGANARVGYYVKSQPAHFEGPTDTNGVFGASYAPETDLNELGFEAKKSGFYTTRMGYNLFPPYDPAKWNVNKILVLKRIGKPVAMYAKWVNENPPILGQALGYDLVVGDWVCAGHRGVSADIIFEKWAYRKSGADYEYKVKITFPKAGDGIQVYSMPESEVGSEFRSPHTAPQDGYQPALDKERSAHPGQVAKNDSDPNRIYLFRVRTVLDENGNVKSALYGKIYGDFMQFTYYLNPTANDRNIEFDPARDLLANQSVPVP